MSKRRLADEVLSLIKGFDESNKQVRKELGTHTHKMGISQASLQTEIINQIPQFNELDTSQKTRIKSLAKEYAKKIADKVYDQYKQEKYKPFTEVVGQRNAFSVIMHGKADGGRIKNVFTSFKNSIKGPKNELIRKINEILQEANKEQLTRGNFLDLGHKGGSAIARFRRTETIKRLTNVAQKEGITQKDLIDWGFTMTLSKKDTLDKTVFQVGFEGASRNRLEGAGSLKKVRKGTEKALNDLLKNIVNNRNYEDLKGSDSRREITTKKIIKSFQDGIKNSNNIKLTKKVDTKIKLSNGKEVSKTKKDKTKPGKSLQASIGQDIRSRINKGQSAQSVIGLATLINQKLPQTVMANMKPPALQNRTGRFAQSVRVTDVMLTQKGYPSIGYTYRKNPYQTFEMGQKQGSKDRDPRNLIDKSIREIAAELLVGRFFTRRN